MALTEKQKEEMRQYAQKLKAQQAPPTDMRAYAQQLKSGQAQAAPADTQSEQSLSPTFMDMTRQIFGDIKGIGADYQKRVSNTETALAETKAGKQSGSEFMLQTLGESGGLIGDVLGRGISAVGRVANKALDITTPDFLEKPLREAAGSAMGAVKSNVIDPIAAKYGEFEKSSPRAARNVNAVANIASAIPILGVEGAAAKGAAGAVRAVPGELRAGVADLKLASQAKHIDDLENTYMELATQTKAGTKNLDKINLKQQFLDKAGTEGAAGPRILSENGIIPKQVGLHLRTSEQADQFLNQTMQMSKLGKDAVKAIEHEVGPISLADLEKEAMSKAQTAKNIDSGNIDAIESHISEAFNGLRKRYGDSIPLSKVDEIKTARFGKTPFDSAKPLMGDANYIIGKTMQKAVETKAAEKGYEAVAQFNRLIGDRISAAEFLRSLNGNRVIGGRLGKATMKLAGSIAGSVGGGALGGVLGYVGGDILGNILVNNSIAGPVKRMILDGLKVENPKVYQETIDFLMKKKLMPEVLALPPGKSGMTGGQINLPYKMQNVSGTRQLTPEEAFRYKVQANINRPLGLPAPGQTTFPAGPISLPGKGILEGRAKIIQKKNANH